MTKSEREELLLQNKKKIRKGRKGKNNNNEGILVVAVRAVADEVVLLFNIHNRNLNPLCRLHMALPKEFAWARAEQNLVFLNTS